MVALGAGFELIPRPGSGGQDGQQGAPAASAPCFSLWNCKILSGYFSLKKATIEEPSLAIILTS